MESIIFELKGNVAWITLNRPKVFNSFNREMALELQSKLDECESNSEIRCVVLKGEGKAFCAGQDLAEAIDPDGPELSKIVSEHYNPIIERLRKIEKPIIAGINGVAAGAGANIAFACDITIATESASFIQAFSKIGLIPDSGGTYTLPRLIGFAKASALMMTGEKVSAADAEKMGMIYKYVADADFEAEVEKMANYIGNMPTKGLGLTKRGLNEGLSNDLTAQLALEDKLQTEAGQSYDYNEGVQAFLDKRKPEFKGK
jgi:2-(1,2-epoxy-1,2-dihydrophenyl)acetyl-CoA isomerase